MWGLGFRGLGVFRVRGLGFRGLGFRGLESLGTEIDFGLVPKPI